MRDIPPLTEEQKACIAYRVLSDILHLDESGERYLAGYSRRWIEAVRDCVADYEQEVAD